jgi:two-component system LytT family response regulator
MNILIIEDERLGAERLASMLKKLDTSISICDIIESIADGLEWFRAHPAPDLVFMDIELSDGSCFQLLNQIDINCGIIFTTSYNEYALEAFKYNSIGYLTKPIREISLQKSLEKFAAFKELFTPNRQTIENLQAAAQARERFLVRKGQKYISVTVDDIAYFYSEERVVFLVTLAGNKYITDYTLDELETMTDGRYFYRANRAFILHARSVVSFQNDFSSRLRITVQPGIGREIMVSREKATQFKEWMGR